MGQTDSGRLYRVHGAYYGDLSDTHDLANGQSAPLHVLDIYAAAGNLSDLSTVSNGPAGTRRTDLRISTDIRGEVYFLNKRNGWIHRLRAAPNDMASPWQHAFPEAVHTAPGLILTNSLGAVFIQLWPWLYSEQLGWLWIAQPTGEPTAGNWIYLPR